MKPSQTAKSQRPRAPKGIAPSNPLVSYAVLVSERSDRRRSVYVEVCRESKTRIERRSAFQILDRLDARLESYLRDLANAEYLRRTESVRRVPATKRGDAAPEQQIGLL